MENCHIGKSQRLGETLFEAFTLRKAEISFSSLFVYYLIAEQTQIEIGTCFFLTFLFFSLLQISSSAAVVRKYLRT